MGCCASEIKPGIRSTQPASKSLQLAWNTDLFQAKSFIVDSANIKLTAQKRKAHRIISKQAFPSTGKVSLKIRYVSQKVSSYSIGVFHFGIHAQNQSQKNLGKNAVRLYVSKVQGNFQSEGQSTFCSKDWRVNLEDTIVMTIDMNSRQIDWRKQNNHDSQTHKTVFPTSFASKTLYFELIMYEPETQLNIQV